MTIRELMQTMERIKELRNQKLEDPESLSETEEWELRYLENTDIQMVEYDEE